MDDAVGLEHVGLRYLRPRTLLVLQHDVVAPHRRPQHAAADGLQRRRAISLLDPLLQISARESSGHDVVGSTLVNVLLFSGLSNVSTVPAGSLANAAFVGANTVKGPGLINVSTRPAALTAATSVV